MQNTATPWEVNEMKNLHQVGLLKKDQVGSGEIATEESVRQWYIQKMKTLVADVKPLVEIDNWHDFCDQWYGVELQAQYWRAIARLRA